MSIQDFCMETCTAKAAWFSFFSAWLFWLRCFGGSNAANANSRRHLPEPLNPSRRPLGTRSNTRRNPLHLPRGLAPLPANSDLGTLPSLWSPFRGRSFRHALQTTLRRRHPPSYWHHEPVILAAY